MYSVIGDRYHNLVEDLDEGSPVREFLINCDLANESWEKIEYKIPLWKIYNTKEMKTMSAAMKKCAR